MQGKDVKICPANQAVYSMEINSCALSLYLQSTEARKLCKRTMYSHPIPSQMERHGSSVLYYVPEAQSLHLRCSSNRTWVTTSMVLQGGGVLSNAGSCFLTLPGLQMYPALRGELDFAVQAPVLYVPDIPVIISDH
jgi:hypothetical protein